MERFLMTNFQFPMSKKIIYFFVIPAQAGIQG
jgi:hypothetical protein